MPDYVTGTEFSRWMVDEAAFRDRLERRMVENARIVTEGMSRIETHLTTLNGRTGSNTSGLSALETRLIRIEKDDDDTLDLVNDIKKHGCSRAEEHAAVLTQLSVSGWTVQKKAVVGGGMVATGALIWPTLQEGARAIHALLEWMVPR